MQALAENRAQARTQAQGGTTGAETVGLFAPVHGAREVSLFYDPPYENELDDRLARHLVAYLTPAASLEYKATVWTAYMSCRFDFLIDLGTRRVAVDYSSTPDDLAGALVEDNDALALGSGVVDMIFRVRRRDLEERMYDCLHVIAQWEPHLFTPYGRRIFASRSSHIGRRAVPSKDQDLFSIVYPSPAPEEFLAFGDLIEWPSPDAEREEIVLRRLSRENPAYWERQFERASMVYGMKLALRTLDMA